MTTKKIEGLAGLRVPFLEHQISKLPKPTKKQTEEVKADYNKGKRCTICGTWHHPQVVHLDYVGHAALTDRLLDCDPLWVWEPLALDAMGYPAIDKDGGMWIKLTVCGVTRLGYGDAQGKLGGDAMKERIGDALRNAAMRFGAALDLWHKGELHVDAGEDKPAAEAKKEPETEKEPAKTATPPTVTKETASYKQISKIDEMVVTISAATGQNDNDVLHKLSYFKTEATKDKPSREYVLTMATLSECSPKWAGKIIAAGEKWIKEFNN